jgi:hypothetical protein
MNPPNLYSKDNKKPSIFQFHSHYSGSMLHLTEINALIHIAPPPRPLPDHGGQRWDGFPKEKQAKDKA